MTVTCIKAHTRPHPEGGTRRYYPGDEIEEVHIKAALEDGTAADRPEQKTRAQSKAAAAEKKAASKAPENKADAKKAAADKKAAAEKEAADKKAAEKK